MNGTINISEHTTGQLLASIYYVGACMDIIMVLCTALLLHASGSVVEPPYNSISCAIALIITFMLLMSNLIYFGPCIKNVIRKLRKNTTY